MRKIQVQKNYNKKLATLNCNICPFCDQSDFNIIDYTDSHFIFKNEYPYFLFNNELVLEHLLLIPTRHIIGVEEYEPQEWGDFNNIVDKYSKLSYSLYTRPSLSHSKTVSHLHHHLFLLEKIKPGFLEKIKLLIKYLF